MNTRRQCRHQHSHGSSGGAIGSRSARDEDSSGGCEALSNESSNPRVELALLSALSSVRPLIAARSYVGAAAIALIFAHDSPNQFIARSFFLRGEPARMSA